MESIAERGYKSSSSSYEEAKRGALNRGPESDFHWHGHAKRRANERKRIDARVYIDKSKPRLCYPHTRASRRRQLARNLRVAHHRRRGHVSLRKLLEAQLELFPFFRLISSLSTERRAVVVDWFLKDFLLNVADPFFAVEVSGTRFSARFTLMLLDEKFKRVVSLLFMGLEIDFLGHCLVVQCPVHHRLHRCKSFLSSISCIAYIR